MKEEIESKTLLDFGNNVKGYNSWLLDTKKEIVRQEGTGKYNEYIRYAFKTYLTSTNEEFNEAIKDVKRRWTQDLLPPKYSLTDLMATTSKTYNNIVADGGWVLSDKKSSAGHSKDSTETKTLRCRLKSKSLREKTRQGQERQVLVRLRALGGTITWIIKRR